MLLNSGLLRERRHLVVGEKKTRSASGDLVRRNEFRSETRTSGPGRRRILDGASRATHGLSASTEEKRYQILTSDPYSFRQIWKDISNINFELMN